MLTTLINTINKNKEVPSQASGEVSPGVSENV
jgi:hypothetical protein